MVTAFADKEFIQEIHNLIKFPGGDVLCHHDFLDIRQKSGSKCNMIFNIFSKKNKIGYFLYSYNILIDLCNRFDSPVFQFTKISQ